MEGLLIAEQLRALAPLLPAERRTWRFPDERTAVLPLASDASLWLTTRPPSPWFELRPGAPGVTPPRSPFQEQLVARAVGELVRATQPALDRIVRLEFAPGEGFVPEPGVTLVAELTGRNANLILLSDDGVILGVERVISSEQNRYRQLRPGIAYVPPPPYEKLNPLEVDDATLAAALDGRSLAEVRAVVDGMGPQLLGSLKSLLRKRPETPAGHSDRSLEGEPLHGRRLTDVVAAVRAVAHEPSATLAASGVAGSEDDSGPARRLAKLRREVEGLLKRRLKVATRRVADAEDALAAASDAERLRREADLILANASRFEPAGETVTIDGYDGAPVSLQIDPRLDAAANAAVRYDRARRRAARAARAESQLPVVSAENRAIREALASLESANESALEALGRRWAEPGAGRRQAGDVPGASKGPGGSGRKAHKRGDRQRPGVRFLDPRGYEVYVGRSARENDAITFKLARSRDLWLHVQGYRGAHVVVRTQGRELPFDTVLFAARLAAGFSQAKDSDNVAVDYTERKNVWRQKGGPAGAVNFAHHKTVYVTPARDDEAARGAY